MNDNELFNLFDDAANRFEPAADVSRFDATLVGRRSRRRGLVILMQCRGQPGPARRDQRCHVRQQRATTDRPSGRANRAARQRAATASPRTPSPTTASRRPQSRTTRSRRLQSPTTRSRRPQRPRPRSRRPQSPHRRSRRTPSRRRPSPRTRSLRRPSLRTNGSGPAFQQYGEGSGEVPTTSSGAPATPATRSPSARHTALAPSRSARAAHGNMRWSSPALRSARRSR